jgi:2-phosphosulfolactate phosphatase
LHVSTSLLPPLGGVHPKTDVAVVIDVLRATSVMATALQAGASQIVTCREVAEAIDMATRVSPRPLLCGERGCQPIEGFDLGNSPSEYVADRVAGKTLVLTTTNGTRAIESAADAERMITASFLNFSAVIEALEGSRSVQLVCAGTNGEITAEDALLAGAILWKCESHYGAESLGDDSTLARELWRSWFPDSRIPDPVELTPRLRETRGGTNLVRLGYEKDLELCAAVDSVRVVPTRVSRLPMSFGLQAK